MPFLLVRWLILTLTIFMVPYLVPGIHVDGFGAALATAAILGILNVLVKPILLVFTFPLTLVSLGLFILVINAFVFQLAGSLVRGIEIKSFASAFFGAIVVSLVSWITNLSTEKSKGSRRIVVMRGGFERPLGRRPPPRDLN